jgi:hypothetical protein
MPRKSRKRTSKTRKQNLYVMRGCSKSCRNKNKNKKNPECPKCGPNCHCGPNCNCSHPCPGQCYLNRRRKKSHKGGAGSGCGSCGCPIAPYKMNQSGGTCACQMGGISQMGGTCGTCGLQQGGNFFKSASAIPGPDIGNPWGASPAQWPTMDGISNNRNYLSNYKNVIGNDPQLQMSMNDAGYKTLNSLVGGKRRNKSRRIKGGSLVPQDLVNLGSDLSFNLNSAYNAMNGFKAPVNPLPYKDQFSQNLGNNKF